MKKFISMFTRHWAKSPGKLLLTLFAVALGTGILILSFSASLLLKEKIGEQLSRAGSILWVANGTWGAEGDIEQNRPSEWDAKALNLVVTDGPSVSQAVLVTTPPFHEIRVGQRSYQLRTLAGTAPAYFDILNLSLAAGTPMTDEDVRIGAKKMWISGEMADMLFGSAEAAVGQHIQPPGIIFGRRSGQQGPLIVQYTVAGVFQTPSEEVRRSYGIGDLLFPYTAMTPPRINAQVMKNFMSGLFLIKSDEPSVEKVGAEVGQILTGAYGEDVEVTVWEGTPRGISSYQEELRQAVKILTVAVNILGVVLLLTSSLGIFSIMVVEALNRRKDIALERAIGASRGKVVKEFWSWSFMLSLLGALAGTLLALVLAKPVLGTLNPLVGELSETFSEGIRLPAALGGIALALGCGGLLGLLPAFAAVKDNIADGLREE